MTTTTDRPIIFGAESIRAILDGMWFEKQLAGGNQ